MRGFRRTSDAAEGRRPGRGDERGPRWGGGGAGSFGRGARAERFDARRGVRLSLKRDVMIDVMELQVKKMGRTSPEKRGEGPP